MFDSALTSNTRSLTMGSMARTRVRRLRPTRLAGAALLVIVLAAQGAQALGRDEPAPDRSIEHVVRPGDSLWSIAVRASDGVDTRPVVDAIERANGLAGEPIVPGQVLRIPTDA